MTGFMILINGIPRTFRDRKEIAYEAGMYLKLRNRSDIVQVRDEATGDVSAILPDGTIE